jgi:hypothetical protein
MKNISITLNGETTYLLFVLLAHTSWTMPEKVVRNKICKIFAEMEHLQGLRHMTPNRVGTALRYAYRDPIQCK